MRSSSTRSRWKQTPRARIQPHLPVDAAFGQLQDAETDPEGEFEMSGILVLRTPQWPVLETR